MNLPQSIIAYFKPQFTINDAVTVGGGCINDCYRLQTSKGAFFLKLNNARRFPKMFETEAKGLALLSSAKALPIPHVFEYGEVEGVSFLLMENIPTGTERDDTMLNLGRGLAALHKQSNKQFGLEYDNYLGSLPQQNTFADTWSEFFVERRLRPQMELAAKAGLIEDSVQGDLEILFARVPQLFPVEEPALLHGDLWSGNYLVGRAGEAYLCDPAVYYGHREMDIAMSRMFGAFDDDFYVGYTEVYPLQKGWEQRIGLCNLYPLLAHVNLFGGSYVNQLSRTVKSYL